MLKTKYGVGNGIRTRDPQSHSLVLYPAELYPPLKKDTKNIVALEK